MIRLVLAASPALSLPCFQALLDAPDMTIVGVVSQADRPSGRGMKLRPSAIKKAALEQGIDVLTPQRLRHDADALAWLQAKQADVLVVVAFGMLLPLEWLQACPLGALNVHASLLPRWRGAAPIERAVLAGDKETGVCIMQMDAGLDTGALYAVEKQIITAQTRSVDLYEQLLQKGSLLLLQTLRALASGGVQPVAQAAHGVTYAEKLTADDRLLDWQQDAVQIDRVVRAFSPRPGARCRFQGRWLKILSGQPCALDRSVPAASLLSHEQGLLVTCGKGCYRLDEVQPEGKRPMAAADWWRGLNEKPEALA